MNPWYERLFSRKFLVVFDSELQPVEKGLFYGV